VVISFASCAPAFMVGLTAASVVESLNAGVRQKFFGYWDRAVAKENVLERLGSIKKSVKFDS